MQVILKALYESYRAQILLTGTDGQGNHRLPKAYLYAVSERMFPYFHQEWCGGDDLLYAANIHLSPYPELCERRSLLLTKNVSTRKSDRPSI